jgi:acetyltransferase-like isoleucine patch superfamily enzyme
MTAVRLEHDWFPVDLPANVQIGEGSWVYSSFAFRHYVSERGVRIGRRSGLYNGTFLDLGPQGEVSVGDYCTVVGAIVATNGRVVIDDYAFIAHEVVIADTPAATPHGAVDAALPDPVVAVGEDAWIGARAVLLAGARIGRGAVVGAAAVVDGDVPAYAVVGGNPSRIIGSVAP